MLSPLFSWILSPSSSSSSSAEEEILDISSDDDINHENDQKLYIEDDENGHFLRSCDVDDTIPVALAIPNASTTVTVAWPVDDERNSIPATATATSVITRPKGQRSANYTGMVRQYQRLWKKEDEMELLKGYLDYIKQHRRTTPTTSTLQNDVASLYDHVRHKLNVDFNKNQLVEKLHRLKRKHKLVLDKGKDKEVSFRNPHEQAIFEISHKIWGNNTYNITDQDALEGDESGHTPESHDLAGNAKMKIQQVDNSDEIDNRVPKRLRLDADDDDDVSRTRTNNQHNCNGIQGFIEETMKSCLSPLPKDVLDEAQEEPVSALVPISMSFCPEEVDHEQWKKHRILELEVYLKQLELLQDQIKARLDELRSI